MELFFLIGGLYALYVGFIIVLAMASIKKRQFLFNNLFLNMNLIFAEVVFTIIGPILGFCRFDQFGPDIPFAKPHVLSIIILVMSSSAAYWLSRVTANTNNPFLRILFSIGILQGILLCFMTSIHFIAFIPMGILFPMAGFELLSPVVALFLLTRQLYFYNRVTLNMDELLPYHKELGVIPWPHKVFQLPLYQRMWVYAAFVVLAVIIQAFIATAFGQQLTSIYQAYHESIGFVFSSTSN